MNFRIPSSQSISPLLLIVLIIGLISTAETSWSTPADLFAVPAQPASPLPAGLDNPVDFHTGLVDITGKLLIGFSDISIPARGWALTLIRTYSPGCKDTGLGPDWAWSLEPRLEQDPDSGNWLIHEGDGSLSWYEAAAEKSTSGFPAIAGRLNSRLISGKNMQRIFVDGSVEKFDSNGLLLERRGVHGRGYILERNPVGKITRLTHDDGQNLIFTWAENHLTTVTDHTGRTWKFAYQDGWLASTEDPLQRQTRFDYQSGKLSMIHLVTSEAIHIEYDANSHVSRLQGPDTLDTWFQHWGNKEAGRMIQTFKDATDRSWRLEMIRNPDDPDTFSLVSIDPLGNQCVRDFHSGQVDVSVNGHWLAGLLLDQTGTPHSIIHSGGNEPIIPGLDQAFAANPQAPQIACPDSWGYPRWQADGSGQSWWCRHDELGRITARAGSSGVVETFDWDAGNRPTTWVDETGQEKKFQYDTADHLLQRTGKTGVEISCRYNLLGLPEEIKDNGDTYRYRYDAVGRLLEIQSMDGAWQIDWDRAGRIATIQNQTGEVWAWNYDASGLLTAITGPDGITHPCHGSVSSLLHPEAETLPDGRAE